jgi:hypothetical protein
MALVFTSDTSHANGNITVVTNKNTVADYKQQLEKAKEIEKREHKTQQSRDDASTIQHLKTLNDELSKLSVVPLPHAPSIKYSHKKVTGSDFRKPINLSHHKTVIPNIAAKTYSIARLSE